VGLVFEDVVQDFGNLETGMHLAANSDGSGGVDGGENRECAEYKLNAVQKTLGNEFNSLITRKLFSGVS
jgi:hypothetical protein